MNAVRIHCYRDDRGVPRVSVLSGHPLIASFLEQDVQASADSAEEYLSSAAAVEQGKKTDWIGTGNAHTVTILPGHVIITNVWDESLGNAELSIEELKRCLREWISCSGHDSGNRVLHELPTMRHALESLLAELGPMLYGLNYQVWLRAYRVPFDPVATGEWYIYQALGTDVVIGNVCPVSAAEVMDEVEQSLRYAGDSSSGPKPEVLQSERFNELVAAVLADLSHAMADATLVSAFWLREGHPAYPVFWDFAFVIAGSSGGLVFIGSSSD